MKNSFILRLQTHLMRMKQDVDNLKIMLKSVGAFPNSTEYEQISQMTALREMQVEAGIKALTF